MTETHETIKRFARNTTGQDYVVGDIHGEFHQLEQALGRVGFDPRADRLFSVGDLIDRGRDSPAALRWLAAPWFHAILGNHEAMCRDAPGDPDTLFWWTRVNGGEWWLEADDDLRQSMLQAVAALPLVIEVETEQGTVGLVHADIPEGLNWKRFLVLMEKGDTRTREAALWSRARIRGDSDAPVEGIDRVYCGHTPVDAPQVVGNVIFIDTGACYGRYLTVLPLDTPLEQLAPSND